MVSSAVVNLPKAAVSRLSGGSLIDFAPVISFDSAYIFVGSRLGDIHIFSAKTAAPLGTLESEDELLGFDIVKGGLEPHLMAAYRTENGVKIRVWNYESGEETKETPVKDAGTLDVRGFFALWTQPNPKFFLIGSPQSKRNSAGNDEHGRKHDVREIRYAEKGRKRQEGPLVVTDKRLFSVHPTLEAVAASASQNMIAGVDEKGVTVHSFARGGEYTRRLSGQRTFLCVAIHPHEETVAIGDITGRIVLFPNVFVDVEVQSIYHWHNNPLRCLSFSNEGIYMFSGGNECCVVKHPIQHSVKGRDFLSWMPAPIVKLVVSPDSTFYVTAHEDNGIRLIPPERTVKAVIQGLTRHFGQGDDVPSYPVGILVDPRSSSLVLNGLPGHLQFCSLEPFQLLYNFDVCALNYAPEERQQKIHPTDVVACKISEPTGQFMATVEVRNDFVHARELRVKIWSWDEKSQGYAVNHVLEMPETAGYVTGIEFQPVNVGDKRPPLLVITTQEKTIRSYTVSDWNKQTAKDGYRWECFDVHTYGSASPRAISFCADGSLLAVSYGKSVVLFNPDPLLARCQIEWPETLTMNPRLDKLDDVKYVAFGRFSAEHTVVLASSVKVVCWSLLDLRPTWSVGLNVQHMFSDPGSAHIAVLTKENKIYVLKPTAPHEKIIVDVKTDSFGSWKSRKRSQGKVRLLAGAFTSVRPPAIEYAEFCDVREKEPSDIICLADDEQLYRVTFSTDGTQGTEEVAVSKPSLAPALDMLTPFGRLVSERTQSTKKKPRCGTNGEPDEWKPDPSSLTGKTTRDILDRFLIVPSHSLPGMRSLCRGYFQALVEDKKLAERARELAEEAAKAEELEQPKKPEPEPKDPEEQRKARLKKYRDSFWERNSSPTEDTEPVYEVDFDNRPMADLSLSKFLSSMEITCSDDPAVDSVDVEDD